MIFIFAASPEAAAACPDLSLVVSKERSRRAFWAAANCPAPPSMTIRFGYGHSGWFSRLETASYIAAGSSPDLAVLIMNFRQKSLRGKSFPFSNDQEVIPATVSLPERWEMS